MTKGAGEGVTSVWLQLGPLEPINEVFPKRTLLSTVKLRAEDMAIPYPKAPERRLLITVPERLTLLRYLSPNQVRGPMAMPILRRRVRGSRYVKQKVESLLYNDIFFVLTLCFRWSPRIGGETTEDSIVPHDGIGVISIPRVIVN